MNVQFRDRPASGSSVEVKTAIADCDIHPARATATELYPFLAKRWHAHLETYGKHAYQGLMEGPPYPKAQPTEPPRRRPSAGRRPAGLVAIVHANPASRSEQRGARRAQSAQHRAGTAQPGT